MSKIRILGLEVEVRIEDREPGSLALGRSDSGANVIWIWKGQNDDSKALTTIHEYVHIVSDILHLELSEEQVSGLALALYQSGFNVYETL